MTLLHQQGGRWRNAAIGLDVCQLPQQFIRHLETRRHWRVIVAYANEHHTRCAMAGQIVGARADRLANGRWRVADFSSPVGNGNVRSTSTTDT